MSRPKLDPARSLGARVHVRLPPSMLDALKRFALRQGETESVALRAILRDRLRAEGFLRDSAR